MTTATDRPDPRLCTSCGATEGGCDSSRLFRGDRCCPDSGTNPPTTARPNRDRRIFSAAEAPDPRQSGVSSTRETTGCSPTPDVGGM
jgi:hypothetical protein